MNLVVPMASPRESSRGTRGLPLYLHLFHGTTLLEYTIALVRRLTSDQDTVIFVMDAADAADFHMRQMVEVGLPRAIVVTTRSETQGALCTVLLAIDHLKQDEPILIVGANALYRGLSATLSDALSRTDADAVTWVFKSVNPSLSFVRSAPDGLVLESSEKNPISDLANSGIFLFRSALDFLEASFAVLRKEWHTKGIYFVAPVLNEIILRGGSVYAMRMTSRPPIFFSGNELSPSFRPEPHR